MGTESQIMMIKGTWRGRFFECQVCTNNMQPQEQRCGTRTEVISARGSVNGTA